MSTARFRKGQVVEIEGQQYSMQRQVDDDTWQLERTTTGRIRTFSSPELRILYANRKLRFVTKQEGLRDTQPRAKTVANASNEALELAKMRRLYVKAVESTPNTESELTPRIREAWGRLSWPAKPPSWSTVYRWKNRYQTSGGDLYSLLPDNAGKGNRAARFPDVSTLVEEAIEEIFMTPERGSIQNTADEVNGRINRENQLRPVSAHLPNVSPRHVRTMISRIPAYDRYAARFGVTAAEKMFRAVLHHRATSAPLELAEVDHTPLDVMVLDDETLMPLGRPYLTAIIDSYTRCALGFHISFVPPSYETVAECLRKAMQPKDALLQSYPSITNTWEAHGVMHKLVVDNGMEFHSVSLENACYALGIEIGYTPRKTPWLKGKIERFLGTLNRETGHTAPGKTFANIFEKADYDPIKDAVLRYSTLKEIVTTWVVDVYHQRKHRTLGVPPAVLWEKSIAADEIRLPDDPKVIDFILGKSESRVLTHKGIELYSLLYNSPELVKLRRLKGESLEVSVRVNPENLGEIHVSLPGGSDIYCVPCLQEEYAQGLSLWQHNLCKRHSKALGSDYSPEGWLESKLTIRELIEREMGIKSKHARQRLARARTEKTDYRGAQAQKRSASATSGTVPAVLEVDRRANDPTAAPPPNPVERPPDVVLASEPRPKRRFQAIVTERLPSGGDCRIRHH